MTDDDLAQHHGVSIAAVQTLREALRHGGGGQAQFSHPELGGMGQWSAGGMTQVGDMFNTALRDKVNALATALSTTAMDGPTPAPAPARDWWPDGLGRPAATGGQNGMRYAYFPDDRRVAVEQGGTVTLYDSGEHRIGGVQQQSGELRFTSQLGTIAAADLPVA